jgi:hypothetical protein
MGVDVEPVNVAIPFESDVAITGPVMEAPSVAGLHTESVGVQRRLNVIETFGRAVPPASFTRTCIGVAVGPLGVNGTLVMFWLLEPPLNAASAGLLPLTNAAVHIPESGVESALTVNELPVKLLPDFAMSPHAGFVVLHGAWAVKVTVSGEDAPIETPLPWMSAADGRVTPAGGATSGSMDHPEAAVRLNEPIEPLSGASMNE